ncbi:MAG: CHASE4 domain-containing protein [Archaeoglobaceae archaeon]
MKTREKVLLITVSISLVLLFTLTSIIVAVEEESLMRHSMKYAEEKSETFEKIFYSELKSLETLCIDWAFWDDTYEFIEDRNERYIASNLVEDTFTNARINVMVFINKSGDVVFSKFYDKEWNEKELPEIFLSPEIRGKTGFLKFDGEIILLASKPILPSTPTSLEEGRGYLVMGRILDENWFHEVSEVLNANILIDDEPQVSEEKSIGKIVLKDVLGQDTIFVIESENPYYFDHMRNILLSFFSFVAIIFAFSASMVFLLDRELISKILKLEKFVSTAKPGDRIELSGTEEIEALSNAINEFLSRIAKQEEEIKFLTRMLRHDLSNVLTATRGYMEVYEIEKDPEYLKKAMAQSEKGIELLRASRVYESSELKKARIGEVIESIKRSSPIEIELKGDAEILADEGLFFVFNNLIENSIKHGRASKVSIEIERGEKVRVLFRDNGKGFSDTAMKKVFKEIYTEGGSGIGLHIVKRLVEKYGGEIRILDKNTIEIVFPPPKTGGGEMLSLEKLLSCLGEFNPSAFLPKLNFFTA